MDAGRGSKVFAKGLILAAVALFAVAIPNAAAQARGVPASVTSIGFGGNFSSSPGIPASVTSIGPRGLGNGPLFFSQPAFNRGFPGNQHFFPHHHNQRFFGGGIPVLAYPYAYPVEVPVAVQEQPEDDQYNGGPTIFDRRGSGPSNRLAEESYRSRRDDRDDRDQALVAREAHAALPEPVAAQPPTALVFKDGHSIEVSNYAIIGSTLYDLTPGHPRKILLADLDVPATEKQNDDRGVDFNLPPAQQ